MTTPENQSEKLDTRDSLFGRPDVDPGSVPVVEFVSGDVVPADGLGPGPVREDLQPTQDPQDGVGNPCEPGVSRATIEGVKSECSIDGCDRPAFGKGLCQAHYMRQRRGVSLDRPIMEKVQGIGLMTRISPEDWLELSAEITATGSSQYAVVRDIVHEWAERRRKRK